MKILGIETNYASHNKMSHEALSIPKEPVIFTKPDSALLKGGKPFFVPDFMGPVHFQAVLAVRICRLGKSIPERFAHRYYDALTLGIDFTAVGWQERLRTEGLPWDVCKGFDGSAALGEWVSKETLPAITDLCFCLHRNGQTVQEGHAGGMLFPVERLIAYISRFFTLKTGDILYTGAPQGSHEACIDDHLEGFLDHRKVLDMRCK